MIRRLLLVIGCLAAICSTPTHAVYFPAGIDWANPSQNRFIFSMYLNMLGRAPQDREISNASRLLSPTDNSQARLDLFKEVLGTREYQQNFGTQDNQWRVYRAPDMNYNNGNGYWRYVSATTRPSGFEGWNLSGSSSESVAESMAHYYDTFCYQGTPCIVEPSDAYKRGMNTYNTAQPVAHACADESRLVSQFEWIADNGTTYPRGTDGTTLCMGQHYYKAVGVVLQRYECDSGYVNCKRDEARDIRGQRTGRDASGKPTLFFANGTRLVLRSNTAREDQIQTDSSTTTNEPALVDSIRGDRHACANPAAATSTFRWRSASGTSESKGVGSDTVCMEDFYYKIAGITLKRHDCSAGYIDCRANPSKDITASKRQKVDGYPGLEFRNGTTLALIRQSASTAQTTQSTNTTTTVPAQPTQRRRAGQHECADTTLRVSQFRWTKQNGTSSWPDGVAGRYVCFDDSYYEIQGSMLRHHQCDASFQNCRANRRNDLIAVSDTQDGNGNTTLVFANGDRLSLISR